MTTKRLGLIMNGVTGRMGLNQHLIRSIIAIRDQGGVVLANGDRMLPDPILIGRDADKLERLARRFNVQRWSTDPRSRVPALPRLGTEDRLPRCLQTVHRGVVING